MAPDRNPYPSLAPAAAPEATEAERAASRTVSARRARLPEATYNELAAIVQEAEVERLRAERDALLRVLDELLIQVEPLRYEQKRAIEEACREKRKWADEYNRTCGNSNEMWFYMTEYRRLLESALDPLKAAILEGNRVFDEITSKQAAGLPPAE